MLEVLLCFATGVVSAIACAELEEKGKTGLALLLIILVSTCLAYIIVEVFGG